MLGFPVVGSVHRRYLCVRLTPLLLFQKLNVDHPFLQLYHINRRGRAYDYYRVKKVVLACGSFFNIRINVFVPRSKGQSNQPGTNSARHYHT